MAAFRRKPTCFEKSASFGFLPKEVRPSLPSGSFTSGGEDALSERSRGGRASSRRKGKSCFLREPLALSEGSRKAGNVRLSEERRYSMAVEERTQCPYVFSSATNARPWAHQDSATLRLFFVDGNLRRPSPSFTMMVNRNRLIPTSHGPPGSGWVMWTRHQLVLFMKADHHRR